MTARIFGMTKKLAISVPDDVAERLAQEDNVSGFVTRLVRGRMGGEEIRRIYRERGTPLDEDAIRRAGEEMDRLQAAVTPEFRAEAEEFAAKLRARHPDALKPMRGARQD
jgi:hypothetical protein